MSTRRSLFPVRRGTLAPRNDVFALVSGELDRMLNQTFGHNFFANTKDSGFPRFDAYEADGKLHLEFHVSGVPQENLSVEESEGVVTVSGKSESRRDDADYHIKELRKSAFSRSIRLPDHVVGEPEARLRDGVLTLVYALEREPEPETKKIDVKVE